MQICVAKAKSQASIQLSLSLSCREYATTVNWNKCNTHTRQRMDSIIPSLTGLPPLATCAWWPINSSTKQFSSPQARSEISSHVVSSFHPLPSPSLPGLVGGHPQRLLTTQAQQTTVYPSGTHIWHSSVLSRRHCSVAMGRSCAPYTPPQRVVKFVLDDYGHISSMRLEVGSHTPR